MHHRTALALTLIFAIFLSFLGFASSVQAKTSSQTSGVEYDDFILYQDTNGDTVCRLANAAERSEIEKNRPRNVRQINHLADEFFLKSETSNAEQHLTIIVRATAALDANADAKAAFVRAAANWEAKINSPVTIYLDADLSSDGFGAGTLGSTSSVSNTYSYSFVRNTLLSGANTAQKQNIYNSLPSNSVPTDVNNATNLSVSGSIARAIGLQNQTAQPTDPAANIRFNSTFAFDFDASDGITGNRTDFEAVATHEIGHALGFTSRAGGGGNTTPAMWDLYRFRTGTTAGTFTTATRIMTIGGPLADPLQFFFAPDGEAELGLSTGGPNASSDDGGDGNQSSHWKQASQNGNTLIGIMDPRIPRDTHRIIMPADMRAAELFGYNSSLPSPPPNDNFASAQVVTGCTGTTTGTNLGATHEANEPNHSPDNGGGFRSIWYNWTAPQTGPVQVTTAGSSFDTVMAVYTGNSVDSNALTSLGKNDDAVPGNVLTSIVSFDAVAGTTYRIAVDGYNNGGSQGDVGTVTFNWATPNCGGNAWVPTTLAANQVTLKAWTMNGRTSIYTRLDFPSAGYRVANWGTPVQAGNVFNVDAAVEQWNGVSAQVLTNTAQIYDLGNIPEGNYTFNWKNQGTTVKSLAFTVSFAPPPANPIDDPQEFVKQQYRDFLRREADGPGLAHWTNEITMCSDPANRFPGESQANCISRKRANTSAAFFLSPECQNTGYFVLRVYLGSLGRMPHFGGGAGVDSEFTRDVATVSNGIVVNDQLSPSVINANKQAFVNQFITRAEFLGIYGGLNDTQYVDKLIQTTGVAVTSNDRNALITEAGTAGGRASVLFKVVDGTTTIADGLLVFNTTYGKAFYDAKFNAAFVQMEYFGYLQRDPDDAGYAFWLGKMNQFGNWVDAQMVLAFMTSPEYRARFGAP